MRSRPFDHLRLLERINNSQIKYIESPNTRGVFEELLKSGIELTQSEFGFFGEVLHDEQGRPYLKVLFLSNIAWNRKTRALYEQSLSYGLEFKLLDSLYGEVLRSGEPLISNDPSRDPRRAGTPPGHPKLKAFAGLPLYHGKSFIGMVGLANRPGGYGQDVLDFMKPYLSTAANLLFAWRRDYEYKRELELKIKNKILLDQVLNQIKEGFYLRDLKTGDCLYVNKGFEELWGIPREKVLKGFKNLQKRIHPEDQKRINKIKIFLDPQSTPETPGVENYRIQVEGGGSKWISERTFLIRDKQNEPLSLAGLCFDVTPFKEMEQELQRRAEALNNKCLALGELLNQIEFEKNQMRERIQAYCQNKILPLVGQLERKHPANAQVCRVLEKKISQILPENDNQNNHRLARLSTQEYKVAELIRDGLSSKEIADFLGVSLKTVQTHRKNIRKKLQLTHKQINLTSFLKT